MVGLAAYQAVIALARNSEGFDFWGGVLMTGANAALLIPMLAVPLIFGGLRSRRLRDLAPPEVLPRVFRVERDAHCAAWRRPRCCLARPCLQACSAVLP